MASERIEGAAGKEELAAPPLRWPFCGCFSRPLKEPAVNRCESCRAPLCGCSETCPDCFYAGLVLNPASLYGRAYRPEYDVE